MNKFLLMASCCLFASASVSQTRQIDSLKQLWLTPTAQQKAKVLIDLCWEYRTVNSDSARFYGLKGLDLARKEKNQNLEVEALHNIGITLEAQGKYQEALDYELPALDLRLKIGDDAKTANSYNNLGIIYDETGNPGVSLEYYHKARKIYERLNDKAKIAMVISNMAIVLKGQREYQKAIPYYHEALAIYKALKNEFGIAACYANLGSVFLFVQNYDSALYYSELSSRQFREQKNFQFLPTTLSNAAQAYFKTNRLAQARALLLEAQQLNEQFNNQYDLAEVLIILASVQRAAGDVSDAGKSADRGLAIAESIDANRLIMEARLELSAIEEKRGNYPSALAQYKLYDQKEDSLFQQDNAKVIAQLQTQFETERKEREISEQKLQLNEQQLLLKRNQIIIVALIVTVLLLTAIFLLIRSRLKIKAQKKHEEQQRKHQEELTRSVIDLQERERERFAKDLHDELGQLITTLKYHLDGNGRQEEVTSNLLNQMHSEIRNISFALWPQVLIRDGLVQAVEELADRLNKSGRIMIHVQALGFEKRLNKLAEITLYRICQEWLTNVLKYAAAKKIQVQFLNHGSEVAVTIEDDGTGFDKDLLEKSRGNGWKNIQSRTLLLAGQLEVDSRAQQSGTIFSLAIPNKNLFVHHIETIS